MILYGGIALLGALLAGPSGPRPACARRVAPVLNDQPGIAWVDRRRRLPAARSSGAARTRSGRGGASCCSARCSRRARRRSATRRCAKPARSDPVVARAVSRAGVVALDDAAGLEHDDLVHGLEAGEPVGDQQQAAVGGERVGDDRVGRGASRCSPGSSRISSGKAASSARASAIRRRSPPERRWPPGPPSVAQAVRRPSTAARGRARRPARLGRFAAGEQQVLAQRRVEHVRVLRDEPDGGARGIAVERRAARRRRA